MTEVTETTGNLDESFAREIETLISKVVSGTANRDDMIKLRELSEMRSKLMRPDVPVRFEEHRRRKFG